MIIDDRSKGIGGSDAAAICRQSNFRDPVDVYKEKIGEGKEVKESNLMLYGRLHEAGMLDYYQMKSGNSLKIQPEWIKQVKRLCNDPLSESLNVSKYEFLFFHPKYDFFYCHADGITSCGKILVEAKLVTYPVMTEWREVRGDGYDSKESVPLQYYYQVQFNMMVSGCTEAHLVVWLPREEKYRIYKFQRDTTFIIDMRSKLKSFWQQNVIPKVPPAPLTREEVIKLTPEHHAAKYLEAGSDQILWCKELADLKEDIKKLKQREKNLVDSLACSLEHAEGLKVTTGENGLSNVITLATFKSRKSKNSGGTRMFKLNKKGVNNV